MLHQAKQRPARNQAGHTYAAGFSYLGVLVILAIAAIGMQGAAEISAQQVQKNQARQLLEAGEAMRLAIGRYYEATPGAVKEYPPNVAVLLEDKRFPSVRRHLRKAYHDPFFPQRPLSVILRNGRIIGVHSESLAKPVILVGFAPFQAGFETAKHYRDWQFIYEANTLSMLEEAWAERP